ncbi:MAG: hypothetical protein ACE15F_11465 [bacterium]
MDEFEKRLWNARLDAQFNVLYWGYLGNRYERWNQSLKIFLAVFSSGTVASWLILSGNEIVWKCFSMITALAGVIQSFLQWDQLIKTYTELRSPWVEIWGELDSLWIEFHENSNRKVLLKKCQQLRHDITNARMNQKCIYLDKKLCEKCYNEIWNQVIKNKKAGIS